MGAMLLKLKSRDLIFIELNISNINEFSIIRFRAMSNNPINLDPIIKYYNAMRAKNQCICEHIGGILNSDVITIIADFTGSLLYSYALALNMMLQCQGQKFLAYSDCENRKKDNDVSNIFKEI